MSRELSDYAELMPLAEWRDVVKAGFFNEYDGSGRWVKDGHRMTDKVFDDVFAKEPEGATHVEWFSK